MPYLTQFIRPPIEVGGILAHSILKPAHLASAVVLP